jgi:hypothetical protein
MERDMANFVEELQRIVELYRNSGKSWPASSSEIAEWAVTHDLFALSRGIAVSQCAEMLARAMREEYITDSKGRRVRKYHAARMRRDGRQQTLWADLETASRPHMELAFAQRRQQIVGDCRQLKDSNVECLIAISVTGYCPAALNQALGFHLDLRV